MSKIRRVLSVLMVAILCIIPMTYTNAYATTENLEIEELSVVYLPDKMEYVKGYIEDNYLEGLVIKALWSDGSSDEWKYYEYNQYIREEKITIDDETINENGQVNISCGGKTVQLTFNLIDNPVKSIEIIDDNVEPLMEFGDGYYTYRWNEETQQSEEYFYYSLYYSGFKFKINYKDGTYKIIKDINRPLNGYKVNAITNQSEEPWSAGGENKIIFSYLGATAEYSMEIEETPVKSIEIIGEDIIENSAGYYTDRWNEETEQWEEYFDYSIDYSNYKMKINYKNGTSKTVNGVWDAVDGFNIKIEENQSDEPWGIGKDNKLIFTYLGARKEYSVTIKETPVERIEIISDEVEPLIENVDGFKRGDYNDETQQREYYFYYDCDSILSDYAIKIYYKDGTNKTVKGLDKEIDGYDVLNSDTQDDIHWSVGKNNEIVFSYLNKTAKAYVEVVENPVDYITIDTAPNRVYVWGDVYYGTLWNSGEYTLYPTDYTGLTFTVYYKDGSSDKYTYEDMDKKEGKIDGYEYHISTEGLPSYIDVGEYNMEFEYRGVSASYKIQVIETNVASIEIVKTPDINPLEYGYETDMVGLQLKVTYTDGTNNIYTLNESNIEYVLYNGGYYFNYEVMLDGNLAVFTVDDSKINAYYMGCFTSKYIKENSQKDIEDIIIKEVVSKYEIIIQIVYNDGTTETIETNPICDYSMGDGVHIAYSKTDKGLFKHVFEEHNDIIKNGKKRDIYVISVFDEIFEGIRSEIIIGDDNNDGSINAKDVALLRRYLGGGFNVEVNTDGADVNLDGAVNAKDVAILRRYLAGGFGVVLG